MGFAATGAGSVGRPPAERGNGLGPAPVRWAVRWLPLLLLAVSSQAFAQAAAFDPRCGTAPTQRSYEPPAWVGDTAPVFSSAAAAEAEAEALKPQVAAAAPGEDKAAQARRYAEAQRDRYFLDGDATALREAIRAYAVVVREEPGGPGIDRTLFRLAVLLEEVQQPDRARQVYHRLILDEPGSPFIATAYLRFGLHYQRRGDSSAALRFFEKAAELRSPQRGLALYLAAWAAKESGDGTASRAFAERALAASRGRVHAAVRADWCAFR